jgi:Dual specificity phosphatase, catalytic domain
VSRSSGPDVSAITDFLYISAWPRGDHAKEIRALNVRLILSMHWIRPSSMLSQSPVRLLWLPTFDNPLLPMPMGTLERGVEAALPVIADGYRVLVHCRAGVHRSVAMACCVLIGTGLTADEAMALVKQKRSVADPHAGYIQGRIYQFEQHWHHRDEARA